MLLRRNQLFFYKKRLVRERGATSTIHGGRKPIFFSRKRLGPSGVHSLKGVFKGGPSSNTNTQYLHPRSVWRMTLQLLLTPAHILISRQANTNSRSSMPKRSPHIRVREGNEKPWLGPTPPREMQSSSRKKCIHVYDRDSTVMLPIQLLRNTNQ